MKKVIILVSVLVLILLSGWAGATYVFASKTESAIDQLLKEANETTSAQWDFISIEKLGYEKGFTSSTATSAIYPSGKGMDMVEGRKLFLKHTIYHGPLAMTPDGPKVCGAYTISVVDWSRLGEDVVTKLKEIYGDEEPVTLRSTQGIGGAGEFEIEVAAADFTEDGGEASFGGFLGTIVTDSGRSKFSGEFEAKELSMVFPNAEGSMEMHPSAGDFSYTKGKDLSANLKIGAVDIVVEDGTMNFTESTGVIDIKDDSHFKVELELGDLEMVSPPEDDFTMSASGLVFTADFSRIDDNSLITIGKGELRAPKLDIKSEGNSMLLSDFKFGVESGADEGKLFGQAEYGFGGIELAGEEFAGADELSEVLSKGASIGFGVRGIDRQAVENFYQFIEIAKESPEGTPVELERLALELVETLSDDLFDLFQPGLEIFYEVLVGETGNGLEAKLSLKMEGEKRLDELKTGREIVNAIEGTLRAEMAKSFLPDETMQMMMMQYVQQGLVQAKPDESGYEFKGDLTDGVLHLAGEATPLLESFGPALDQPIPWEGFKSGMKAGVMDKAAEAIEARKKNKADAEPERESDDTEAEKSE